MSHQQNIQEGPTFYTVRQISQRHQVHEVSVRRWLREGRLRAVRLGRVVRVSAEELQRFEEAGRA
ncbi:MAG: helix-turn-helix domain-containing protein [Verrucomicrobiaceae bacterium]